MGPLPPVLDALGLAALGETSWAEEALWGIPPTGTTEVPGPRAAPASWAAGAILAPGPRTGLEQEDPVPVARAVYLIILQKIFV